MTYKCPGEAEDDSRCSLAKFLKSMRNHILSSKNMLPKDPRYTYIEKDHIREALLYHRVSIGVRALLLNVTGFGPIPAL